MPEAFAVLFPILIAVPGLLILIYIIWRMSEVSRDEQRERGVKAFAGGTIVAMVGVMGLAVVCAQEFSRILNVWM
jgi:4-hydroxybenzoate polyprenyltransferase